MLCDGDVEGNVAGRRIAVTKQREGATGWCCEFTLRPHKIATDEDGEDVVSAYLQPEQVTAGPRGPRRNRARPPSGSSSVFVGAFATALEDRGENLASGDGPPARVVAVQRVREAFDERYEPDCPPESRAEACRKAFDRALRKPCNPAQSPKRTTVAATGWCELGRPNRRYADVRTGSDKPQRKQRELSELRLWNFMGLYGHTLR